MMEAPVDRIVPVADVTDRWWKTITPEELRGSARTIALLTEQQCLSAWESRAAVARSLALQTLLANRRTIQQLIEERQLEAKELLGHDFDGNYATLASEALDLGWIERCRKFVETVELACQLLPNDVRDEVTPRLNPLRALIKDVDVARSLARLKTLPKEEVQRVLGEAMKRIR